MEKGETHVSDKHEEFAFMRQTDKMREETESVAGTRALLQDQSRGAIAVLNKRRTR